MKASEMAVMAARIMSERGHCKHKLEDEQGRVCFNGALQVAGFGKADYFLDLTSEQHAAYQASEGFRNFETVTLAAERILCERGVLDYAVGWNNELSTTGEDVILLLKEAGSKLEEAGQ